MNEVRGPAARPCASCPYRRDVPSGVWAGEEYAKLPAYDRDTAHQPLGAFLCHQRDGHLCAGWVGCHDMDNSLALRSLSITSPEAAAAALAYVTDVPLWESGHQAWEHGVAELENPSEAAQRVAGGLARKREGRG